MSSLLLDGISAAATASSSSSPTFNHDQPRTLHHRHRHRHLRRSNVVVVDPQLVPTTAPASAATSGGSASGGSTQYVNNNDSSITIIDASLQQPTGIRSSSRNETNGNDLAAYSLTNADQINHRPDLSQNEEFNVKHEEKQLLRSNNGGSDGGSGSGKQVTDLKGNYYQFLEKSEPAPVIGLNQFSNSKQQASSYGGKSNSRKGAGSGGVKKQEDVLRLRLADLINPNRNQTFIDNLYAQFQPDSSRINLVYVAAGEMQKAQPPENSVLLNSQLLNGANSTSLNLTGSTFAANRTDYLSTLDANKLLNEFYLDVKAPSRSEWSGFSVKGVVLVDVSYFPALFYFRQIILTTLSDRYSPANFFSSSSSSAFGSYPCSFVFDAIRCLFAFTRTTCPSTTPVCSMSN